MTCPSTQLLAEWLEAEHTRDPGLREHIESCARCRGELAKLRALTAQLGHMSLAAPAAAFSGELARKLQRPSRVLWPSRVWGATALAACALLSLWRWDGTQSFRARGGVPSAAERVGFEVQVHAPGRSAVALEASCLAADSGYSFTIVNRTRRVQSLMLFALDARSEVHWFYPAYLDPHTDPRSIAIAAEPQVQNLPEGVTPEDLAPGVLQFVALFSRAAHSVSEIEALIGRGDLAAVRGSDPSAVLQITRARVCP